MTSIIPNTTFVIDSKVVYGNNQANSVVKVDIPSKPGYRPLCIAGYAGHMSASSGVDIYEMRLDLNNNKIHVGWTKAVATNYGVTVFILYCPA